MLDHFDLTEYWPYEEVYIKMIASESLLVVFDNAETWVKENKDELMIIYNLRRMRGCKETLKGFDFFARHCYYVSYCNQKYEHLVQNEIKKLTQT